MTSKIHECLAFELHVAGKKTIAILLFLCFAICGIAQGDVKQSLIVAHMEPGSGAQFRQQIFSYHFLNGSYVGREELLTVTGRKEGKDYIRTDIGANTLYKERYLITGMGNIIDLQEKKVLFDGRAALMRCHNDSAVFYTNDIFKGKFYSVYDFKSGTYGEVKDLLFRAKTGQDVEFDKTSPPFRLYYYPQGKPKEVVSDDMGYGQQGTGGSHVPDPPLCWLNNTEFVYGHFNQENTELSVYKINLNTHKKELLGKVVIKPEAQPASINWLDETGLMIQLGQKQIFVDMKNKTVASLDYTRPCHGFSYECVNTASGRLVKLDGKEVGKFHFKPSNFKTEKNIAAFVKEITIGEESYQQGLAVWNVSKNNWVNVEAEEVLSVIGWINR
jgi:hypothetical protein